MVWGMFVTGKALLVFERQALSNKSVIVVTWTGEQHSG
jgi:hypothetical protein